MNNSGRDVDEEGGRDGIGRLVGRSGSCLSGGSQSCTHNHTGIKLPEKINGREFVETPDTCKNQEEKKCFEVM